jgi:hypothetical protein
MDMYQILAKELLNCHQNYLENGQCSNDVTLYRIHPYGEFGFIAQMNYSGLMAQPSRTGKSKGVVKREKQGLFDIYIKTGDLFGESGITHREIIESLIEVTSLEKCIEIWRGANPEELSEDRAETAVLTSLLLLFFEQEVNWGQEIWQRFTYFSPLVSRPNRVRPRDMLMGYINQAFNLGIDNIAYWQYSRPTTTTFIAPDKSNYGYEDYRIEYKQYFLCLENDEYANALVTGDFRKNFRYVASQYPNNRFFGASNL